MPESQPGDGGHLTDPRVDMRKRPRSWIVFKFVTTGRPGPGLSFWNVWLTITPRSSIRSCHVEPCHGGQGKEGQRDQGGEISL